MSSAADSRELEKQHSDNFPQFSIILLMFLLKSRNSLVSELNCIREDSEDSSIHI